MIELKYQITQFRNPEDPSAITSIFSEHTSRMVIGGIQGGEAYFGEDKRETVMRSFLDHEAGIEWLKARCRERAGRDDIDFLLADGAPQIVQPTQRQMQRSRII